MVITYFTYSNSIPFYSNDNAIFKVHLMSLLWPFHILLTDCSCCHLCLFIFHWTKCWQIIPPTVSLLLTVFMNAAIPIAAVLTVSPTSPFLLFSFSPSLLLSFWGVCVYSMSGYIWRKSLLSKVRPVDILPCVKDSRDARTMSRLPVTWRRALCQRRAKS